MRPPTPSVGLLIGPADRERLFSPADLARLAAVAQVRAPGTAEPLTESAAVALLTDCVAVIGHGGSPRPTALLLDACPALRLWEHVGSSVHHLFGPHLDGRDLMIASCKAANAEAVAEMTIAEIILGIRGALTNAARNRVGPTRRPEGTRTLYGATVGVVGASEVGKRVARLAALFGAAVLLYDPYAPDALLEEVGAQRRADLVRLCADSDVVTLHTPANDETRHLLRAEHFRAMRDDAVFINTARGRCVSEPDLIAELSRGRLFAFLDVSDPEPAAPDSPLRSLPNVVYTSHLAGPGDRRMGRQAVDDVLAFLVGGLPACPVTRDMLATTA